MKILSIKQSKALRILSEHPDITASQFGRLYFDGPEYEYLHTAVTNQGNGACIGKKAWLCAGSFLAKLERQGLALKWFTSSGLCLFRLTEKGKEANK